MHRAHVLKQWIDSYLRDEAHPLPPDVVVRFFSVLRIRPDEEVAVFDGHGRQVVGYLVKIEKQSARFGQAVLKEEQAKKPRLTLIQAAIDEAKMGETIKRSTEFGIDRLVIFKAKNSEKYCFDKLKNRNSRLWRMSVDAARQSGRLFIPEIEFLDSLANLSPEGFAIFGDPQAGLLSEMLVSQNEVEEVVILVGPEGGLALEEKQALKKAQFLPARWAPYILRTELASLAALAIINAWLKRA